MSQEAQVREFECWLRIVHDGFGRRPASWSPPCPENDNARKLSLVYLPALPPIVPTSPILAKQLTRRRCRRREHAAARPGHEACNRFSLDRILRTSRDLPVALKCRSCLPCAVGQITGISPRVPCPWIEGRFAIVTERWARNAMDALAACDERGRGGRRSRVVLISRR